MGQTVFFMHTDQLGPAASTTTRINLVFRTSPSCPLHPPKKERKADRRELSRSARPSGGPSVASGQLIRF
jgi:hypothetical protein